MNIDLSDSERAALRNVINTHIDPRKSVDSDHTIRTLKGILSRLVEYTVVTHSPHPYSGHNPTFTCKYDAFMQAFKRTTAGEPTEVLVDGKVFMSAPDIKAALVRAVEGLCGPDYQEEE